MKLLVVLVSALALLAAACGGDDQPAGEPDEQTTAPGDGAAQAGSLIGVLEGDAKLEGGCVWIEPTGGPDADIGDRVEPLLPAGLTVEFEPDIRIVDAQGTVVAERGDEVVIDGSPAEDVMTICQVGPAYQVDTITGTVGR